jgi:hypothetical protein
MRVRQRHQRLRFVGFVVGLCTLGVSAPGLEFTVALDTAPLIGHPAGPFSLDFQLIDGSGMGDSNNTAIVTNFNFDGGSAASTPVLTGGASGNLSSGITLAESSFFNDCHEQFSSGSNLTFTVQLTTNLQTPQPDEFSFAILDSGGNEIPTTGPADALLIVAINSVDPAVQTFSTDPSIPPVAGGLGIDIPAAMISIIPEPSTLAIVVVGLAALLVGQPRRAVDHPTAILRRRNQQTGPLFPS